MFSESERTARADRANAILSDETFQHVIDRLAEEYTRISIDGESLEEREEARKYVKLIRSLPGHFSAIVFDGHVAQKTLDEEST